ncbi:MAG TPA: cellulase family glycosylhydrolase, partial [Chitinispirillaceae bacterium]|nr:cellulase family glycosylhydrolase [Chitinispirillaceae bacterium]
MLLKRFIFSVLYALFFAVLPSSSETAVERHGQLKTSGPYILNKNNEIVQLRGMSFYWSKWEGPQFYTADIVNQLADSWKCTVVRVAYANGSEGWSSCQTVIDAAIKKGIYVIIDWHSHNAHEQETSAISFFKEQAKKYKDIPNVIFEPFNEPIAAGGASQTVGDLDNARITWAAIKPYLKNVTKAIRAEGAENLVILGTPFYSQFVKVAANDRVVDDGNKEFANVAYSFHFYAASHGSSSYYMKQSGEISMVPNYLDGGLGKVPIFITEWGTSHSDGGKGENSYVDAENTKWWFTNYVDKNHLSHCNWSVNNSGDASSAFSAGGGPSNPSASGNVAKKYITVTTVDHWKLPSVEGKTGPSKDSVFAMPATQPAVSYNRYWGANFDTVTIPYLLRDDITNARNSKNKGILVSAGITSEEWIEYNIKSSTSTKNIIFRYLAFNGSGSFIITLDGEKIATATFTKTATDSTWSSILVPAAVTQGGHKLRFSFTGATGFGYYLQWFELTNSESISHILTKHNSTIECISISKSRKG